MSVLRLFTSSFPFIETRYSSRSLILRRTKENGEEPRDGSPRTNFD